MPSQHQALNGRYGRSSGNYSYGHLPIITAARRVTHALSLVGGIGEYQGAWRMAYVRGPEGIIVSLAERIG